MAAITAKSVFRPSTRLEVFYTGGAMGAMPDDEHIVCACGDQTKVVELASGKVTRAFQGDSEPITALAVSPNGRHVFTGSRSLTAKCWDVQTGECVRSWKPHRAPISDIAVDASGGLVATASADREVRVWDVAGGFATHSFRGHGGVVLRLLFHPRQLLLVSAGDDAAINVWDLVDKNLAASLQAHFSAVTCLAWSPDGWHLFSGGRDKVVVQWDIRTNAKLATIPVFEAIEALVVLRPSMPIPGASAAAAASSARAVHFATAGEAGVVRVWNAATATSVYSQPKPAGGRRAKEVTALLLLRASQTLVTATADCRVAVLHCTASALKQRQQLVGNSDEISAVKFLGAPGPAAARGSGGAPEGVPQGAAPPQVAVATNSDQIHVFASGNMNCDVTLAGHSDIVLSLATTQLKDDPSCWLLASGSKDNSVRVWHVASGKCVAVGLGHLESVAAVAFGAKGAPFLLSGGVDKLARVWNLEPLMRVLAEGAPPTEPLQLSVSATVAAHDKDINCVAFAPNNSLAATGSQDRSAKLWSMPALAAPITLRGHRRGVWDIRFSPVDQVVMTASGDCSIKLWSVKDGACLKTLAGHIASVLQCAFLSAGTQIVSAGGDGLVKLWNVRSGECVNTFECHEDKVWGLDVGGPHDDVIVTGGADACLVLWSDCTEADKAAALAVEEERLEKQQDLANALVDNNYLKAARLAFQLKHPGRLLEVVKAALAPGASGAAQGEAVLARLVSAFEPPEISLCLQYLRDWNTRAVNCHSAQALLHALLASHHPATLAKLEGIQDVAEAVALYTERHYKRMDRLLQSTYLLDHLLASMHVMLPDAASAPAGADADSRLPLPPTAAARYQLGIGAGTGAGAAGGEGPASERDGDCDGDGGGDDSDLAELMDDLDQMTGGAGGGGGPGSGSARDKNGSASRERPSAHPSAGATARGEASADTEEDDDVMDLVASIDEFVRHRPDEIGGGTPAQPAVNGKRKAAAAVGRGGDDEDDFQLGLPDWESGEDNDENDDDNAGDDEDGGGGGAPDAELPGWGLECGEDAAGGGGRRAGRRAPGVGA